MLNKVATQLAQQTAPLPYKGAYLHAVGNISSLTASKQDKCSRTGRGPLSVCSSGAKIHKQTSELLEFSIVPLPVEMIQHLHHSTLIILFISQTRVYVCPSHGITTSKSNEQAQHPDLYRRQTRPQ